MCQLSPPQTSDDVITITGSVMVNSVHLLVCAPYNYFVKAEFPCTTFQQL